MDFIGELATSLGLGDIPILNPVNKKLHQKLISCQIECETTKNRNQQENESINRIFGHVKNIKDAYTATKHLVNVTKEQESTENDLRIIADNCASRNHKQVLRYNKEIDRFLDKNEELEEDVAARETINQLLDDEHETDISTLMDWSSDVDQYEEDIFTLLKFHHQDAIRTKELHLKLERAREKVGQCKKELDAASTESRMAQLALDKTADAFRNLHMERLSATNKWQETLNLIAVRENELQEAFEKVSTLKNNLLDLETELKEQSLFLDNENGNNKELQHHIDLEETKIKNLTLNLDKAQLELKDFESEITLEKRSMWKVNSEIECKKIRMRETKKQLNRKKQEVEKLQNDVNNLKDQKISCNNRALTSEERANQMQRLLDHEQLQFEMTETEFHKAKGRLLQKEKELRDLSDEEDVHRLRLKALTLERSNLDDQFQEKKVDLIKREDVAVASDQRLVSLEREIARIKGTMSLDNRAELKSTLENFKIELESRQMEKRNMDHLVHKMMSEVKKVHKDIENTRNSHGDFTSKLEEILLVNESCNREHKQLLTKVEGMLLEERSLKLTERKIKEDLEMLNNELTDLRKEDLEINEQLREQGADLESKRELYISQSRVLKDEISTIKSELRERRDRIEKLKVKYDLTVKAMGEPEISSELLPSHARHMVKVAQEKSELLEQTEILANKIVKEEEELAQLEKAMSLMKNSNNSYRATNCRNGDVKPTDKMIELENSMKNKVTSIKRFKRRLVEVHNDIEQVQYLVYKSVNDMAKMQAYVDGKKAETVQMEKELKEQDRKLFRARKVSDKLSQEIKDLVPNPEAYEHDMDLREEKEKQRTSLIQVREISMRDENFGNKIQSALTNFGLSIPPVSRLEARASRSKSATTTGGYRSASTSVYSTATGGINSRGDTSGGYYRQDQGSDSVVLMEVGATRTTPNSGRAKTAMTAT